MHCFTGKKSLVKKVIDNNWFLTAPTCITRSTQFQENIKLAPINQIFCETDAPYLSPFKDARNLSGQISAPIKMGKRNEPAHVRHTAEKLAEIKNIPVPELIRLTSENARRLFNKLI